MAKLHAVVLAGGRSSRLHATAPKPTPNKMALHRNGKTLLETTLESVQQVTDSIVVVGEPHLTQLPTIRENPPFSGPAMALVTGIRSLPTTDGDWVLLLAGDMPNLAPAVETLHAVIVENPAAYALIGEEDGKLQPMTSAIKITAERLPDIVPGDSVMRLLKPLSPVVVQLPSGSTQDIDTWHDATELGFG